MTRQTFNTSDVLRLEIEVAPTGLTNLIANPDGKLGAWGWITPVAGSYMEGISTGLRFTAPNVSAAAYFTSEPMPIVAGQYAAAAWDLVSISGYVRVRFEWLNSSYGLLSSSTQSGYLNTVGAAAYSPQVAPASTAFVRLRFDHYSNTSAGNPAGNAQVVVNNVKVAKAATSGALGSGRTNLVANPSFEVTTTGWSTGASSITRSTAVGGQVGSAALRMVADGPTISTVANAITQVSGVIAGRDYVVSAYVRSGAVSRTAFASVRFLNSGSSPIAANVRREATTTTSGWTRIDVLVTAPTGAVTLQMFLGVDGPGAGEVHYFDAVMVTEGTDLLPYFDGSTASSGTKTHAWTGTAHDSASTLTDTTLGSLVPTEWRNILGPSHEIKVERESLNLGTLTAEILDATLDPSQTTNLRPGRRVRLLTLVGGVWEPLFTGKTTRLDVDYDEKSLPVKPPRISLAAVDATQSLAAARRPDGVAQIHELPYVLEGAGVPWRVNGSGNQVAAATVVSNNDNATALDQIAVTRDSKLGIAYVSRSGVLVANDYAPSQTFSNGSFDVNANGWTGMFSATLARVTTPTADGAGALRITSTTGPSGATSGGGGFNVGANGIPVMGGGTYRVTAKFRAAGTGRDVQPLVRWYNSAGDFFYGRAQIGVTDNSTGWTTYTRDYVAPPNAAFMAVDMTINGTVTGEIHYMDSASVALVETQHTLSEAVYSDLDLSFSSEQCINSVTVKRLAWDPADPTKTVETVYGPYEDSASVTEWGRCSAEFTVHGIAEANVAAYAASILTRNAQPVVQVNTVTVPIKDATDTARALMDLTDLAAVTHVAKVIAQTLRINKVTHRISPNKWLVDLGFEASNSVASPQATPPVQSVGAVSRDVTNLTLPGTSGYFSSNCRLTRRGDVVDLYVEVECIVAAGGNVGSFTMPPEHFPAVGFNRYFDGLDASTGAVVPIYLSGANGTIAHVFGRSVGQRTLGHITYIAVS